MRVKEWIEALSGMNPDLDVRAMNIPGEWVEVVPIQVARVKSEPMRREPPQGPFVKVVREGDEWGHG